MGEEKVKLEWNKYKAVAETALQSLYYDEDLTDVTLACEGGHKVLAHKIVLSLCSDFFRKILQENRSSHPLIYLQGVGIEHLELLKKIIYLGYTEVESSKIKEFHGFAKLILDIGTKSEKTVERKEESDKIKQVDIIPKSGTDLQVPKTNSGLKTQFKFRKVNFKADDETKPKLPMNHRFSCNKCHFIGTDMEKMKRHIEKKHNKIQKEKTAPCPVCGKVLFNSSSTMKEHIERVHGDKSITYSCDSCSFTTSYEKGLKMHFQNNHDPERRNYCDQCDFQTGLARTLREHIENRHSNTEYLCDKCDFRTKSTDSLKFHQDKVHLGIRYKCDLCDYQASSKSNLKPHMLSVHEKLKITCSFCTHSDSSQSRLLLHERREHGSNI